jgi:putative ABC transport system permease protein
VGLIELINILLNTFEANGEFFSNPEVDLNVAITALSLLVFVGAFAGLIPAFKAASVNPVEALKAE